jgi:hypothetical protein
MHRWLSILAALAAVLAACGTSRPDPYAGFRQAGTEAIPGTFDWQLDPPGDSRPSLSPERAYAGLPGAGTQHDVMLTFAVIRNERDGSVTPPSWVFITRHLCFFSAKGDLVSPGRFGDGDACTQNNLLVQAVDASTGRLVSVFSAYDVTDGWIPTRSEDHQAAGNDAPSAGATRFH